jgi:hypothetical protein
MATTSKISYVSVITDILNGVELDAERIEKLEALKASLEKRNTHKTNGPTKAQRANAELAEKIFEAMNPDEVYETKAIGGLVPELAEASTQKLTALMKILVASERVKTEKVKGKATYHLA